MPFVFFQVSITLYLLSTALANENCTLCSGGEQIARLDKQLSIDWPVSVQNCSMLDDYATSLARDTVECPNVQSIGTICGCPVPENACRLCGDEGNITRLEKDLGFLEKDFDGNMPSCQLFDAYLNSVEVNSRKCEEAQLASSTCGCPIDQDSCMLCSSGADGVTKPNKRIPPFSSGFKDWDVEPPSCELIEAIVHRFYTAGSSECTNVQQQSYICGCDYPDDFMKRQAILAWLPRISAPLSFFGSLFIIFDVWKKPKNKRTMQHHLLLCISCLDCVGSLAWALTTLPMPATDADGDTTHIYGAKGNEATCTAQGFFIQLGITSPFYNMALAIYYMLVISYGWTEDQLRKIKWYFFLIPLVFGMGLALGGIPLYGPSATMCYISDHDLFNKTYGAALLFLVIPIMIVIVVATVIMVKVYWKVYHQERSVRRWRSGGSNAQSLPRRVFWQSFWYLMCFYVSWPILVVVQFVNSGLYNSFWFLCLAMFVAPIQGFLNFIAYTRRRFHRYMKTRTSFSWKSFWRNIMNSTTGEHGSSEINNEAESAAAVSEMPSVTEKTVDPTVDSSKESSVTIAVNENGDASQ